MFPDALSVAGIFIGIVTLYFVSCTRIHAEGEFQASNR
jgi:hypothetical protein